MERNTRALLVLVIVVLCGSLWCGEIAQGARDLQTNGDEVYEQENLLWSGLGGPPGGFGSGLGGWLWRHKWWPWNWGHGITFGPAPGLGGAGPGIRGGVPGLGGAGPGLGGPGPRLGGGGPGLGGAGGDGPDVVTTTTTTAETEVEAKHP
ncbi:hypothetical protein LINPERPRIM_LOCUS13632 [Linum perenne]